ncbi:hypothetical protein PsYK624_141200 [Phanerochaete sordida]|uniref:F-box domain-containing protein n=1 Tax=Phanerochaete sordida TaxID=48140 RepID=A0A9P3GMY8_9APHY|nr:hypothetical protein PsYK624_141200 [Phanerochaete sordida]
MDELLARLGGLGPLFFALPEVTTELMEGIPILTSVDPPPTSDEWARFVFHARRVRELHLLGTSWCFDDVHTERAFLDILRDHYPGQVLPHLRELDVDLDQYTALRAERFLQSSLVTLRAKTARSLEDNVAFVTRLADISDLQHIQLWYEHYDGPGCVALAKEVSTTVQALHGLRALDGGYHCLSIDALAHLSGLPSFVTLSLGTTSDNISTPESLLSGKFACLTTLCVEFTPGTSPAEWAPFLRAFSSAPIHTLRLAVKDEVLEEDTSPSELLPLLGALGAFPSLHVLELDIDVYLDAELWSGSFLDSTALEPLFRVHTIKDLTFLGAPLSFAPPFMRAAADAWPALEVLRLHSDRNCEAPPETCVPLADLALLAVGCPHLALVDVALAPVPADWTWEELPGVPASRARRVVLAYTEIAPEAAPAVAAFLDRYFPEAALEQDGDGGLRVEVLRVGETLQRIQQLRKAPSK